MFLIDGKALASDIYSHIKKEVDEAVSSGKRQPCLAVILVGDNPASQTYVANKDRTAKQKCGFKTRSSILPADTKLEVIADTIKGYADDPNVDGILLQLPLPAGLNPHLLLNLIPPEKDVDGLHPLNQGCLMGGMNALRPCTPLGIMKLIDVAFANGEKLFDAPKVDLSGKKAVVIGRSILVGKPVALMLLERNATVTLIHSKTDNPEEIARQADIVVAAVGKPELIDEKWIKPNALVIDVGINRVAEKSLVGDVAFNKVTDKCSAITPVPGGVGPMTVAMLMMNTLKAYKDHLEVELR